MKKIKIGLINFNVKDTKEGLVFIVDPNPRNVLLAVRAGAKDLILQIQKLLDTKLGKGSYKDGKDTEDGLLFTPTSKKSLLDKL